MDTWRTIVLFDPFAKLLTSNDPLLTAFVKRDLLDEKVRIAADNEETRQLVRKQQPDGSWIFRSSSVKKYPSIKHNLVETFKSMRILVGKYEWGREQPAIARAAGYLFGCQTEEGDFRGILGNQYMPYYCGLITEYLIRAGYGDDSRIERAMQWLTGNRQTDGGWVVPLQTVKVNKTDDATYASAPIKAEVSLPSSHLATGMVLRAFAMHPAYRNSETARRAGELLKSRFFKPDKYNDRKAAEYWFKFHYPYWWTTLTSSLDSLSRIGFDRTDPDIEKALEWLLVHQDASGLWATRYDKGESDLVGLQQMWITYDICRILKMYF